jgi:hypothetical protein
MVEVDCDRCNYDLHRCPGCGIDVPHGTYACAECNGQPDGGFTNAELLDAINQATQLGDADAAETFRLLLTDRNTQIEESSND